MSTATCITHTQLMPENEAGTCDGRCAQGYRCRAQGNQCIKAPISNYRDLCVCKSFSSSTTSTTHETSTTAATTTSSPSPHPHGCSDADFIGSVVDVPSAEVCA